MAFQRKKGNFGTTMNTDLEKLQACGINVSEGVTRFLNREDFFLKYVLLFLQDHDMETFLSCYENKDVKGAFKAAHSLKATTGNLALESLYEKLKPIVEILRADRLPEQEEITQLRTAYEKIVHTLQQIAEQQ